MKNAFFLTGPFSVFFTNFLFLAHRISHHTNLKILQENFCSKDIPHQYNKKYVEKRVEIIHANSDTVNTR